MNPWEPPSSLTIRPTDTMRDRWQPAVIERAPAEGRTGFQAMILVTGEERGCAHELAARVLACLLACEGVSDYELYPGLLRELRREAVAAEGEAD